MPTRPQDYPNTVAVTIVPLNPTTVSDDAHPATGAPDTNAVTRGAPEGTSLPVLAAPTVPGDLGSCGGHRVLRVLGRGGMGVIYEAIDTALDRPVALKLMRPELAESAAGRERFLREAKAAAAIRHENVVNVYSVGEDAGTPYLSMELLHGDHLAHRLLAGVSLADVVRIGREVALGLAAAHALGVVHRDIKPTNIWIEEPNGRVRLLDFGLARAGGGPEALLPAVEPGAANLTEVGALLGTPAYMSPEQHDGGRTDARTDLFSLGAVLYQLVTGRMPFRGATMPDLVAATAASAFQPIQQLAPATPASLVRLIERLLAADPLNRPQTATAVADELMSIGTEMLIAGGSSAVTIPVARSEPTAPAFAFDESPPVPRRRSPASFALIGTLAVVVALMLVVGVAHRLSKKPPAPTPVPPPPRPVVPVVPSLFNGRDLTGLRVAQGNAGAWAVTKGVLAGTRKTSTDEVLLSEATYSDFELRLEYRWPQQGGHTVVLLRAAEGKDLIDDSLAVNIGDDEGFPAIHGRGIGGLYQTGLIQGVTSNPPLANKPIGEWNHLHVVARGRKIEVKLNGVAMPTAELPEKWASDPKKAGKLRKSGSIGLVCHWGLIDYRNVTIRPLTEK